MDELAASVVELPVSIDGDEVSDGKAMVVATGVVFTSTELELASVGAADEPEPLV